MSENRVIPVEAVEALSILARDVVLLSLVSLVVYACWILLFDPGDGALRKRKRP